MKTARNWLLGIFLLGFLQQLFWVHYFRSYPPGYLQNQNDLQMDFFNTAFNQIFSDAYAEWQTVYSPFALGIAELISWLLNKDYWSELVPFTTTYYAFISQGNAVPFFLIMAVTALLSIRALRPLDIEPKDRAALGFLFLFSQPMWFCFERGNLILFALPALVASLSIQKSEKIGLVYGLLISLKLYFVLLLALWLDSKRFLRIATFSLIWVAILNVAALLFFKTDFSFYGYWLNLSNWNKTNYPIGEVLSLNFSLFSILETLERTLSSPSAGENFAYLSPFTVIQLFALPYLKVVVGLVALLSIISTKDFLKRYVVVMLASVSFLGDAGGYFGLLLLPCLAYFFCNGWRWSFIFVGFALAPIDFGLLWCGSNALTTNFLNNYNVAVPYCLTVMTFFRPIAVLLALLIILWNCMKSKFNHWDPTKFIFNARD